MLKLIYTNPNPTLAKQCRTFNAIESKKANVSSQQAIVSNMLPHFTAKISRMGHHSYGVTACDPSHYLSCQLVLEVRENEDESAFGDVLCHFPTIQDEYLEAFVWEDDTLMGIIMVQFYIKVLEQLLVFCANHNALKLVIHANPLDVGPAEAYQRFVVQTDQVLTHQGRKIALVIPTDRATYDRLIDYMEQIGADFRDMLWNDRHINPIIRQYLKLNKFS